MSLQPPHVRLPGLLGTTASTSLIGRDSRSDILLWDRVLVPLSRVGDGLTAYRWGKSVLGVWRKQG